MTDSSLFYKVLSFMGFDRVRSRVVASSDHDWFPPQIDEEQCDRDHFRWCYSGLTQHCKGGGLDPMGFNYVLNGLAEEKRSLEMSLSLIDGFNGLVFPPDLDMTSHIIGHIRTETKLRLDSPLIIGMPALLGDISDVVNDHVEQNIVAMHVSERIKEHDKYFASPLADQVPHTTRPFAVERLWDANKNFHDEDPAPLTNDLLQAMIKGVHDWIDDPSFLLGFLAFHHAVDVKLTAAAVESRTGLAGALKDILVRRLPMHLPRWYLLLLSVVLVLNEQDEALLLEASEGLNYWGVDERSPAIHDNLEEHCGAEGLRWARLLSARTHVLAGEHGEAGERLAALDGVLSADEHVWRARQVIVAAHLEVARGGEARRRAALERVDEAIEVLPEPWFYADALALRWAAGVEGSEALVGRLERVNARWPDRILQWEAVCAEPAEAVRPALCEQLMGAIVKNPYPRIYWSMLRKTHPDPEMREALALDLARPEV